MESESIKNHVVKVNKVVMILVSVIVVLTITNNFLQNFSMISLAESGICFIGILFYLFLHINRLYFVLHA